MNSLPVLPQNMQVNPLVNVFNAVIDGVTQLAVNARDLHKFLKVGRDFTTWIKSRIEQYVFIVNQDFIIVENLSSPKSGNTKARPQVMTEYHLTLDMAKELAMVENNEEGRKVRRYFIRCEQDLLKSDSKKRELLVAACTKLSVGNMSISDVYLMVGKQFGYEGGIKDIPTPLLPEAVAFVYEMILRLQQTNQSSLTPEQTKSVTKLIVELWQLNAMTAGTFLQTVILYDRDKLGYYKDLYKDVHHACIEVANSFGLKGRDNIPLITGQTVNAPSGVRFNVDSALI